MRGTVRPHTRLLTWMRGRCERKNNTATNSWYIVSLDGALVCQILLTENSRCHLFCIFVFSTLLSAPRFNGTHATVHTYIDRIRFTAFNVVNIRVQLPNWLRLWHTMFDLHFPLAVGSSPAAVGPSPPQKGEVWVPWLPTIVVAWMYYDGGGVDNVALGST